MQHISSFSFTSLLNSRQLVAGWPGKQAKRKQLQHVLALCKIDATYSIRIESRSRCLLKLEKMMQNKNVKRSLFSRNVKKERQWKAGTPLLQTSICDGMLVANGKGLCKWTHRWSPQAKKDNITRWFPISLLPHSKPSTPWHFTLPNS